MPEITLYHTHILYFRFVLKMMVIIVIIYGLVNSYTAKIPVKCHSKEISKDEQDIVINILSIYIWI